MYLFMNVCIRMYEAMTFDHHSVIASMHEKNYLLSLLTLQQQLLTKYKIL